MLGTIVNALAIVVGASLGVLLKKGIPERISDILAKTMGLCTIYIGLRGVDEGQTMLVILLSLIGGAVLGELLDLDGKIVSLSHKIEQKLPNQEQGSFSVGFVTATVLFCTGAMAVLGSLQSGLQGDHHTLFAKAILDGLFAVIFASTMGWGVAGSAVSILFYQGSITLLARWISPLLTNELVLADMTCVGSLILLVVGLNIMGVTNIKAMNMVPGIFLPIFCYLFV